MNKKIMNGSGQGLRRFKLMNGENDMNMTKQTYKPIYLQNHETN